MQNIVSLAGSFAKETRNFKEPTNRSHPIHNLASSFVRNCGHIQIRLLNVSPQLCVCIYIYMSTIEQMLIWRSYGVFPISSLLKIIGLFCKSALSKRLYFAKETCNSKEPTNRSHRICKYESTIVDVWARRIVCMGWLRLVGSLKLWVSFAKNYGSLLRDCGRMSSPFNWRG